MPAQLPVCWRIPPPWRWIADWSQTQHSKQQKHKLEAVKTTLKVCLRRGTYQCEGVSLSARPNVDLADNQYHDVAVVYEDCLRAVLPHRVSENVPEYV